MLIQQHVVLFNPFAREHVVLRLLHQRADQVEFVGVSPCGGNLVGIPFGGAPVKGLSCIDEVVESADGFFNGGIAVRTVSVDEVDYDVLEIGFQGKSENGLTVI